MKPILARIGRGLIVLLLGLTWWMPSHPVAAASAEPETLSSQVQTPDYRLTANGVEVPDYASNDLPGAPRLPLRGLTFDLPANGDWEVTFESVGSRLLDERIAIGAVPVPDLNLNGPTSLEDLATLPSYVPTVNRPDPGIYGANAFYPASPVVAGEAVPHDDGRILPVRVFPFQYNPVTRQLLYHPDLRIIVRLHGAQGSPDAPAIPAVPANAQPKRAIPATGVEFSVRAYTRERGFYRLTYAELAAAGAPVGSTGRDPRKFVLYNDGQPVDIQLIGADDGTFDPGDLIVFYAVPHTGRFQNYNVYSLAITDQLNTAIMGARPVSTPGDLPPTSTITQTVHVERDLDYRSLYERPMNVDHWFDTQLYANSSTPTVTRAYDLNLDDPVTTSGTVRLTVLIHGGNSLATNPDQSVAIRLNSHTVGQFTWDGSIDKSFTANVPAAWLDSAPNRIYLEAALAQLPGVTAYWISPDWLELKYPAVADARKDLIVNQDRIYIEGVGSASPDLAATGFSSPNVAVYDVRDAVHPVQLTGVTSLPVGSVYTVAWTDAVSNRSYYLSTQDALLAPSAVEADALSNWGTPNHQADYIAIVGAQRSFNGTTTLGGEISAAVQPLLDHRAAEGLQVAKVDVLDIYDEFSYGKVDPQAIRDFLTYAYFNWNQGGPKPHYVLLVGDGHYDFTGVSGQLLPNLLPPYLLHVDPWWGEVPVDNRFVSVDGQDDYLPNMAVGRLPANYGSDVTSMVNKILTYENVTLNPPGIWQQRAVYVADDCANSAGDFHTLSNYGRQQWLPSAFTNRKIYYDNPSDPITCPDGTHTTSAQLRPAVRTAFNQGALFLQWFGHGSQTRWGSIIVFQSNDFDPIRVPPMVPTTQLPLTMANACLTGYFVWQSPYTPYPYMQSFAEVMVISPQKGSLVDFSPSGLHVGSALLVLDQGMHRALFQDRIERAGDVTDAAKQFFFANSFAWHDVLDTMIVFGDPATKLRLPTGDLSTSSMAVSESTAIPDATLQYTVTVENSSIFTTTHPVVQVDYPQDLATVTNANGGTNNGDTLSWSLPDLQPGHQQLVTFTLQVNSSMPGALTNLTVTAQVNSPMAPTKALQVNTAITVAPDLSSSSLTANRDWLPPGAQATFTTTLVNTGIGPSANTQLTMTLPTELAAPSGLSPGLVYDSDTHEITWTGALAVNQTQTLAFTSLISTALVTAGQLVVNADVEDTLGVITPLSVTVNLAVPDVNGTGDVDIADIQQVAARWPLPIGNPGYHPRYDLNADDVIDVLDIIAVANAWN